MRCDTRCGEGGLNMNYYIGLALFFCGYVTGAVVYIIYYRRELNRMRDGILRSLSAQKTLQRFYDTDEWIPSEEKRDE